MTWITYNPEYVFSKYSSLYNMCFQIPVLKGSCFGCCSLQMASIIIGLIKLSLLVLGSIGYLLLLIMFGIGVFSSEELPPYVRVRIVLVCVILTSMVAYLFYMIILFIIGVNKRSPSYMLPWIIFYRFCVLIEFLHILSYLYACGFESGLLLNVLALVLSTYILLVMYSCYKDIEAERPTYERHLDLSVSA
ncbi:uncharacterized protein LOC142331493 [Lycorma delicatula]|uniref:uncharacterized protein LOC142331493 n=1 Tax=Lycorma delicatula TaxID=130591 RepID=UPI003F5159C3